MLAVVYPQSFNDNMELYYTFDTSMDDSVNSERMTYSLSTPVYSTDRYGKSDGALILNGEQFLSCGDNPIEPDQSFTLSFWYFAYDWNYDHGFILSSGAQTNNVTGFSVLNKGNKINVSVRTLTNFYNTGYLGDYNLLEWHNVIIRYDADAVVMSVFINGESTGAFFPDPGNYYDNNRPVNIGKPNDSFNYFFTGKLDDVKIFNIALTDDEVEYLYESESDFAANIVLTANFNGSNAVSDMVSDGWLFVNADNGGENGWYKPEDVLLDSFEGNGFLGCDNTAANEDSLIDEWMISPVISVQDGDYLSFYSSLPILTLNKDSLFIYYSPDGATNPESFIPLATPMVPENNNWKNYCFPFPESGNVRIAFRHFKKVMIEGDNADFIGLDLVRVFSRVPTGITSEINYRPKDFTLYQNFPNPFNSGTQISFDLPENADVYLKIYSVNGEVVFEQTASNLSAGKHSFRFDGSQLATGVYLYQIHINSNNNKTMTAVKKMILLK